MNKIFKLRKIDNNEIIRDSNNSNLTNDNNNILFNLNNNYENFNINKMRTLHSFVSGFIRNRKIINFERWKNINKSKIL